ncbi:FAD-binding and (Fe-S)-binding domain-containing protein [Cellulosimicrobium cellulans]|uniref:FAD-binding and (Fe-S)-binding domain-containing protein n=1 Tax=Cellulosimicrobium cellulans TaxID=1710 RepID=UPI001EDC0462|nr:FAD-binding and (Fe-S)-binding domain-containing protein [Cellulosimicrobium cellulans]
MSARRPVETGGSGRETRESGADVPLSADRAPGFELRTDLLTRVAQAHDASHYLLRPEVVVRAHDRDGVVAAMREATRRGLPVTFRSGGTSLSGQASGTGVLVDTRTRFTRVEVLDDGARVRCEPGATLRLVNAHLLRHGRRLGPDPASEIACTIGGVVANNSSGMTSGTTRTAYRTVEAMTVVLPSGTVVDTGAPDADARLLATEPELHRGLVGLRDRVRGSATMRAEIERQFATKNTMGYSVNAFLDHDEPVKILEHLMIGSEGTLGWVADVTFRTVPLLPHAATTLLVLDSLEHATDALVPLVASGAEAIELLDAASLRVAAADPAADASMRTLARGDGIRNQTALLVEYRAATEDGLAPFQGAARDVVGSLTGSLAVPATVTTDPATRARLWRVRKGLYTAVAGARPAGSTALLEDVAVPVADLTATVRDLGGLFARHGYGDAVTFGHAKDGNLHFMITPRLGDRAELDRYAAFSDDLVDLVLGHGGTLKAEHGTGRIMAPFVRRQYGDDLYDVMREVKRLFDPRGLLSPGVLITDDDHEHLRNLKVESSAGGDDAPLVDRCVECGYCEPGCPSRTVTTTPRQRIALLKEMAAAPPAERRALERQYRYQGVETCAADSLCVDACPVGIDTGVVMKGHRARSQPGVVQRGGAAVAERWGPVVTGLRGALRVAQALPTPLVHVASQVARGVVGADVVPRVDADLPGPGARRVRRGAPGAGGADGPVRAVLFASCMGELFAPAAGGLPAGMSGGEEGDGSVSTHAGANRPVGAEAAFRALCERAGIGLAVPEGIGGLCCGTPWTSKGLPDGAAAMARKVVDALWAATREGELPVVCDASSCTHGLVETARHLGGTGERAADERSSGEPGAPGSPVEPDLDAVARERFARLRIVDAVTFVRTDVLPGLAARGVDVEKVGDVVLHPTCATVHLDAVDDLRAVAEAAADRATVPAAWGCCGFAGDRGMLHPELTAGATRAEAAEVAARAAGLPHDEFDAYVSNNRTCEMGMSRATGRDYVHVLELLEAATRPAPTPATAR